MNKSILRTSRGVGTWPIFGYTGAAEGLKHRPCIGQKKQKILTLSRTTPPILGSCLAQALAYPV